MKCLTFSVATFTLFTIISTVTSQDTCSVVAANAIRAHTSIYGKKVKEAATVEHNTAQAAAINITAVERSLAKTAMAVIDENNADANPSAAKQSAWKAKATFVVVQSSALIASLHEAEASRALIAPAEAVADALASVKALVSLNYAVADCDTIKALRTSRLARGSCAFNATVHIATHIRSNADNNSVLALIEERTAQDAAANRLATVKLKAVEKNQAVLVNNYIIAYKSFSRRSPAEMAALLSKQAATAAFVAVQEALLIAGLQASENFRKVTVDAQTAANAIAAANLLVALNYAVTACAHISALPSFPPGSCAFDAFVVIAEHIKSSSDNVTAAAVIEKDAAQTSAAKIAAVGASDQEAVQAALVKNYDLAYESYTTESTTHMALLLTKQAARAASVNIAIASKRANLIANEALRAVKGAALAASNAVRVAAQLAELNAIAAAC